VGGGVLLDVLAHYVLQGEHVPGFPFLASIVAIFSGAQLFALGIIGEYLARMHLRMMEKPTYVIRTATSAHVDRDKMVRSGFTTRKDAMDANADQPALLEAGLGSID